MASKTRTYYCNDCKKTVDFNIGEQEICGCGYMFGVPFNNTKANVNMRTTWSGQTQVEFSAKTMKESVESMGGKW
tara:strand:+ start:707 stop:931 length:225 start_codon:yes stop_codon:yes gene_type:complete